MSRWTPYSRHSPSRWPATELGQVQHVPSPGQPYLNPATALPGFLNHNIPVQGPYPIAPVSHQYDTVNASGSANLHLGDNHYHATSESVKDKLLSSLHFREMLMRYDNIDEPHNDTFKWILRPSTDDQPHWDSFLNWLNGGGGMYWISGKPGSGKSVLMKYLMRNCHRALDHNGRVTITLSFCFWEAAHTKLERSMMGCLRSLLWQTLQSVEFADRIVRTIKDTVAFEWTKRHLRDALDTALKILLGAGVNVLIFLDGLDEAGEDRTTLTKYAVDTAKALPTLKICVSSRPEQSFQISLQRFPHLRMQALNLPDILAIIQQDLFGLPEFVSLLPSGQDRDRLKHHLIEAAQGVLLWVRIVTRDLVQGIADGETLSKLEAHLHKLPAELDGDQGLYAFMLRRNAASSPTYLADAGFYCKLACYGQPNSILGFCLATDDGMRSSYLEFQNGWEIFHHRLDCDRLVKAVTAVTGGLLEVEDVSKNRDFRDSFYYDRAARSRDPSLSQILSFYGKANSAPRFIHRTARDYIMTTTTGQKLLAASCLPSSSIERVCFETWLITDIVLPCQESLAPVDNRVLQAGNSYLSAIHEFSNIGFSQFEHVIRHMVKKGYFWTEPYSTRLIGNLESIKAKSPAPLMMTSGQQVDFMQMYATLNWRLTFDDQMRTEWSKDSSYLLTLLFSAVLGEELAMFDHEHCHQPSQSSNNVEVILSYEPDPNTEIINTFGEKLSVYHYILNMVTDPTEWHSYQYHITTDWLRSADSATKTRRCGPSMLSISMLYLEYGEVLQNPPYTRISVLGPFCYEQLAVLLGGTGAGAGADDDDGICMPTNASNSGSNARSSISILWLWPADAWNPTMYALSGKDPEDVLRRLISLGGNQYTDLYVPGVGIVDVWEDSQSISTLIQENQARLVRLRSLHEVFLSLGKSTASIRRFIATEEPRIRRTYGDIIYRHWKHWLTGVEDPVLERYQGVQRPSFLRFNVDTTQNVHP